MNSQSTRTDKAEDRAYLDDPPQPLLQGKVPKLSESRRVDNVRFFPPAFPLNNAPTQILAVGISPTPEEAASILVTQHCEHFQKPRLLKGPLGQILKDIIDRSPGLQSDNLTYATAIPWLLPKNRRFRPNRDELEWCKPYLRDLVKHTKPKVIVAFGKLAFDQLVDLKISADDARGGWFDCEGIPVYLMDPAHQMVTQPWTLDSVFDDFKEVARMVSLRDGTLAEEEPVRHQEIRTIEQLEALVAHWEANNITLFAVDNEWKGANFVDGQLRSTQFAWSNHDCAYLNFFNEHGEPILGRTEQVEPIGSTPEFGSLASNPEKFNSDPAGELKGIASNPEKFNPKTQVTPIGVTPFGKPAAVGEFYVDYRKVGEILGRWLNRPEVKYIGHFYSADSTWMMRWLNLEVFGRCVMDTAFAMQTISEYAPLGLERLALQVTNFGRYDMPLVMAKKELKITKGEGYGRIPDAVLVPYGGLDCIVPFRAKPILEEALRTQGTLTYYQTFVLPLVSDTFTHFSYTGLPVDRELFEATRKFMNWAYRELLRDFLESMAMQADSMVEAVTGIPAAALTAIRTTQNASAKNWVLSMHPAADEKLLDHWANVHLFNIRSGPVMTRWLFDVMKFTPVKSTGKPPTMWEKVLTMDPKMQKNFTPAADKETLEILFEQDDSGLLRKLLDLSNVGNICKGFLKEGEVNQDGEVVKEAGLGKHIAMDGFLHAMFALTETCRPRSWAPNSLNLSKYLNKYIARALLRVLGNTEIPKEFEILFGSAEDREGMPLEELIKERVPSVRSVIKAEDGGCFVESDYKTAEIRGQAFISGDAGLIELMTGKDKSFALYKKHHIRLYYPENTKIAPEHRNPELLMAYCEEGKPPVKLTVDDLEKDSNGELLHPPYDLHWSLAEELKGMPREVMNSDIDRGMGKEGNFCLAEDQPVLTRDRGEVPIQDVTIEDQLWDGAEWVSHDGVVCKGTGIVHRHERLWATLGHEVWISRYGREEKMKFGEALKLTNPRFIKGHPNYSSIQIRRQSQEASKITRTTKVYDILNAGPRKRFTCGGVLVSNSGAYLITPGTLERRLEAKIGVKPDPGTGQAILDSLEGRQPVSVQYIKDVSQYPKQGKLLQAQSGRIRHFPVHSSELQGMPWRVAAGILRSMGNEAANFLYQESVAATLARACKWLNDFFVKHGMQARCNMGLYDSCVTYCKDASERWVVDAAHTLFMDRINVWCYHGRYMSYPIDTDFVYRWSWKPSKAQKKELYDRSFCPMDPEREKFLLGELLQIEKNFFDAQPWILQRLNVV